MNASNEGSGEFGFSDSENLTPTARQLGRLLACSASALSFGVGITLSLTGQNTNSFLSPCLILMGICLAAYAIPAIPSLGKSNWGAVGLTMAFVVLMGLSFSSEPQLEKILIASAAFLCAIFAKAARTQVLKIEAMTRAK